MFRFKQFEVNHDHSSMKVGTDGVLLGAWADLTGARRVLDVGTGCGVIALMVAQRTDCGCRIHAVDIDQPSTVEADGNFARSPWGDRLTVQLADINNYVCEELFDVIVTNPPFYDEDVLPPDAVRSAARHTHSLSFGQLMQAARRLLTAEGAIALITPVEARDAVTQAATFAGLHLWRLTTVHSIDGGPAKRLLWQWSKRPHTTQRDTLTIHKPDGQFTGQYRTLCRDFYLRF